jgi:hypothetical protein
VYGKNYNQALKAVPVSNTVMRRIESLCLDVKEQLLTQIKCSSKFSLQSSEAIDVAGLSQLHIFVRYCSEENIHEDFIFC